MEKEVFTIVGQWRNYDDLEECLCLDELIDSYNSIVERENRQMEFQAKIQGAEFEGEPDKKTEQAKEGSLMDRIKKSRETKLKETAKSGESVQGMPGVGYQVIGG